jgi:outer membrane protein OmpA-like peptidoglycan-associated protein
MRMKKYLLLFCLLPGCFKAQLVPTVTMALLQGTVTNFQGKKLAAELITFENITSKALFKVTSDAKGTFELLVPVKATYELKYKNFTVDMKYTKMQIPADPKATYEVEIKIDPPKEFVLEDVFFETGKSNLKPSSHKTLNDLAEVLKLKKTMVIEIQGHTDNVGSEPDNMRLSQERAEAVKKYLVSKAIDIKRITAKGYGPTRPVADNSTDEGKAKNRRTSLKVISE